MAAGGADQAAAEIRTAARPWRHLDRFQATALGDQSRSSKRLRPPFLDVLRRARPPAARALAADGIVPGGAVEEKAGCRDCTWRYWRSGGCAVATFRATGRYDVKSPNCNIYKAIYPQALRLEGLRMLKYSRAF